MWISEVGNLAICWKSNQHRRESGFGCSITSSLVNIHVALFENIWQRLKDAPQKDNGCYCLHIHFATLALVHLQWSGHRFRKLQFFRGGKTTEGLLSMQMCLMSYSLHYLFYFVSLLRLLSIMCSCPSCSFVANISLHNLLHAFKAEGVYAWLN